MARLQNLYTVGYLSMKNVIIILLTTLVLSLSACNGGNTDPQSDSDVNKSTAPPLTIEAEIGDVVSFGGIDWLVLDIKGGKALILSDRVIAERPFHYNSFVETSWSDSNLRAWLNGEFLQSFDERAQIVLTNNTTPDNPWFGTCSGADTEDYVFLLSIEEVVRYFGDSGQLENRPKTEWGSYYGWIDDCYNLARAAYDLAGVEISWWLRTLGEDNQHIVLVGGHGEISDMEDEHNGFIFVHGGNVDYGADMILRGLGVRPAMWVELE